jgi:hypothetical protein
MHLPLKYAASVPVAVAALIGLAFGLAAYASKPATGPFAINQIGVPAFFGAAAALIVLLPNMAAAFLANRFSSGSSLVFCAIFVAVFFGAWLAQARVLDSGLRTIGGFSTGSDWRTWAVLLANVGVCMVAAWWFGRTSHA